MHCIDKIADKINDLKIELDINRSDLGGDEDKLYTKSILLELKKLKEEYPEYFV